MLERPAALPVIPTVKWKESKLKQWFTPATLHLIRVKCRVYRQMKRVGSDLLKAKYKAISNLVRSQTRKDTAAHVTNLSKSYFVNSKKFWNFLNSIKGRCHTIPVLKHNDLLVSDDSNKATIFNKFFHSVFAVEDCSSLSDLQQSLEVNPDLINSIDFSADEVHMNLVNLQKDKSCGPDCVPAYLLKI